MKRMIIVFLVLSLISVLFAADKNTKQRQNYRWKDSVVEFRRDQNRDDRAVPGVIDYQSKITNSSHTPLSGSVNLSFAIYAAASGGSALWTETHSSISVTDGMVHVLLGSNTAFGSSLFDGSDLWLGINVNGDGEMTPRLRIASVPYAIFSETAGTVKGDDLYIDAAGSVGIGTTSPQHKLDVDGNMNIADNNAYKIAGYDILHNGGYFNIFAGGLSGSANSGSNNSFFGYSSGNSNTGGLANTFIGRSAGSGNINGNYNTYLGYYSGLSSTGSSNVFLGNRSGQNELGSNKLYIENSNSSSPLIYGEFDNDFVKINGDFQATGETRDSSGDAGTSGQVLSSTGSGTDWVDAAIGDITAVHAGTGLTGGGETGEVTLNVDLAIDDLTDAKTGGNSVFLGQSAGSSDDGSNNNNVSIGNHSSFNNQTGELNVCVGGVSGFNGSSYSRNVYLGYSSGYSNQGSNNTFVGYRSGSSNLNTTGNVFIGHEAGNYSYPGSNKLFIENSNSSSPLIYGEFDNDEVKINGDFETTGTATIGDVLHLTPMSSAPSSPSEGDIYVNSSDHHIYCYLNGTWKQLD